MSRITVALVAFVTTLAFANAGDWQEITNGKDLSNFAKSEGNWQVAEDGIVKLTPRAGESGWKRYGSYLYLKDDYTDFVCEFEYKIDKKGNSGFYFRVSDRSDAVKYGTEIQLNDTAHKEKPGFHDVGGIIKFPNAKDGSPIAQGGKPAGEWNKVSVTLKGSKISVVMNGVTVQKDKDVSGVVGGLAPKGGICWQDHGLPFYLRNIRIKPL
jgi:hypothetical protein